jgi:hypothetical protein
VASQEIALHHLAAMEATMDATETAHGAGLAGKNGSPFRLQPARTVVELRR